MVINGKLGIGTDTPDETMHLKGLFHQKLKIESLEAAGSASVRLQTNSAAFDYLDIEKFGINSVSSSAGITLAGVSRISAGANAGPLMLQVINSNLPMYFVTNNTLQMTLEGDGDLKLEKKLTALVTDSSDMKAYIYASLTSSEGTTANGGNSGGFSSSKTAIGEYLIEFENDPGNKFYTVITNMRYDNIGFITVKNSSASFTVKTYDVLGDATDQAFNFVVYKQ